MQATLGSMIRRAQCSDEAVGSEAFLAAMRFVHLIYSDM